MVAFWLDLCYNLGMQLGTLNEKGRMMDKDMMDYTNWVWADTVKEVGKGLLIYAVLLGAYWLLVA